MIVISHHRNAALAARKRADLQRANPDSSVTLLSRRSAGGRFSSRGQTFVWEVQPKNKKLNLVLHFDYGDQGRGKLIQFQVHVEGPGDVSDAEAIEVIQKAATDGYYPKGWRERAIFWSKGGTRYNVNGAEKPLPGTLVRWGIEMGEGSVESRRSPAKSNRRAKRKAKK